MTQNLSSRQLWISLAAVGLLIELAIVAWIILNPTVTRMCKPVVPQIIVDIDADAYVKEGSTIMLLYNENGADPFRLKNHTRSPRIGSCTIKNRHCISHRARNEIRFDEAREQSILLRHINGKENPIIGGVRWNGPAFPDRISLSCDANNRDKHKACAIKNIGYLAAPARSGHHAMRRFDRCQPFMSRVFHGTTKS